MLFFDYLKYQYYKWKLLTTLKRLDKKYPNKGTFSWENFKGSKSKEEMDKEADRLISEWESLK